MPHSHADKYIQLTIPIHLLPFVIAVIGYSYTKATTTETYSSVCKRM